MGPQPIHPAKETKIVKLHVNILLNIGVVSNETNTEVRMYNLILLDDLHYSMYK